MENGREHCELYNKFYLLGFYFASNIENFIMSPAGA